MIISDPVERHVFETLLNAGIVALHESSYGYKQFEHGKRKLDFYLPDLDIYVEVKAYSTPRTEAQIEGKNVILIQGMKAAEAFRKLLGGKA